jgi:DNA-binding CsgD family transcriptional regulator
MINNTHWLELTSLFSGAALGESSWDAALSALAAACGARSGELVGFGPPPFNTFNWVSNLDPAGLPDFLAIDGGNPAVNPRVAAGLNAPLLKALTEQDYISPANRKRYGSFFDFCHRHDIPYICQTTLLRQEGMLIGLSVLRSERQGHVCEQGRQVMTAIAPHVQLAVRTQMALEGQGATLLAGALEALSFAAFICDRLGSVKDMTPAAEAIVTQGQLLQLRHGQLRAIMPLEQEQLHHAISAAAIGLALPGAPLLRTVVLHAHQESKLLVLDVIALSSRPHEFSFMPRVLVVARGNKTAKDQIASVLQLGFGLTVAEAEIAGLLADGLAIDAIAFKRGVTEGTVRSQVKTVFGKLGVSRQAELVARLSLLR